MTIAEEQALIKQQTRRVLKRFGKRRGNLVPVLQQIQSRLGYLPREAMLGVAQFLNVPVVCAYCCFRRKRNWIRILEGRYVSLQMEWW